MELSFFKPKESERNAKLTVQKTGRLGFSKGAISLLALGKQKFAKFGLNENKDFFMVMCKESDTETFKISKAGEYFYINAKSLLEEMDIDYGSRNTIIFDIIKTEEENTYELKKRVIEK